MAATRVGRRPSRERPDEPADHLTLLDELVATAVTSDYAGRPGRAGSGSPRQRVMVTAAALAVVGFVIALGFSARVLGAAVVQDQREALIDRIGSAEDRRESLEASATDLRAGLERAREGNLRVTQAGRELAGAIADLELATGYVPVAGPGMVVALSDPVDPPLPGPGAEEDPELAKVLDADVQIAVNGLWSAGAEAIAINDQRLTAQSAIRSAAGAVLVNYRPLRPPYRVEAIGPPGILAGFRTGDEAAELRAIAAQYGIGFETSEAGELRLPAATTALPDTATVGSGGREER